MKKLVQEKKLSDEVLRPYTSNRTRESIYQGHTNLQNKLAHLSEETARLREVSQGDDRTGEDHDSMRAISKQIQKVIPKLELVNMKTKHLIDKDKKDSATMEFRKTEARLEVERYETSKLRMAEHALKSSCTVHGVLPISAVRSDALHFDD